MAEWTSSQQEAEAQAAWDWAQATTCRAVQEEVSLAKTDWQMPTGHSIQEKAEHKQQVGRAARLLIQAQSARNTKEAIHHCIHTVVQAAAAISAEAQAAMQAASWEEEAEEAAMRLAASWQQATGRRLETMQTLTGELLELEAPYLHMGKMEK